MIIEHIIYNLSIAILIGIIYRRFTNRNPTWIIVACALLPDIDYLLQSMFYYNMFPIYIEHGNFHSIPAIITLSIIFGYICTYFSERFYDGIICVAIGSFAHYIEDICVYNNMYYPFFPFNNFSFRSFNILHETSNMFGMGDWLIIIVGIVILVCVSKVAIDGTDCIYSLNQYIRNVYLFCLSLIADK